MPAKIYEYLRARKPILALTDPAGDTARVLLDAKLDTVTPLDDREKIRASLARFVDDVRAGRAPVAAAADIRKHSRQARTEALAELLDEVLDERGGS